MMKRTAFLSLAFFALAACGTTTTNSGTTTSSGGTSGGNNGGSSTTSAAGTTGGGGGGCGPAHGDAGVNVILTSVGVHPAAAAALSALGLTPPPLANNYSVILQAVTLKAGQPKTTTVGSVALTSANASGPVEYDNVSFAGGISSLGVISAININPLSDGGSPPIPPAPTCAQLESTPVGAFQDFYVPAGSQVYFGVPTADICDGVAFALPASFVALLDCAAGFTPGATGPTPPADLLSQGFSLLYASQQAAALGTALANVTFGNGAGSFNYYQPGYGPNSAPVGGGPTSATGLAAFTGLSGLGTVTASDPAGDKFDPKELATPAGDAYMVFYSPGN